MTTYLMQIEAGSNALQWEYEYEMPSDNMALDYASRVLRTDQCAKHAAILNVWRHGSEGKSNSYRIATLVLEQQDRVKITAFKKDKSGVNWGHFGEQ